MELMLKDPFLNIKPGTFSDYGWEVKFERNKEYLLSKELDDFISLAAPGVTTFKELFDGVICAGFDVSASELRHAVATNAAAVHIQGPVLKGPLSKFRAKIPMLVMPGIINKQEYTNLQVASCPPHQVGK